MDIHLHESPPLLRVQPRSVNVGSLAVTVIDATGSSIQQPDSAANSMKIAASRVKVDAYMQLKTSSIIDRIHSVAHRIPASLTSCSVLAPRTVFTQSPPGKN